MPEKHHITLRVEGMTCDGCARHVTEALESVAGVDEVQVPDWRSGRAIVVTNSALRDEDLSKAITKAGYRAIVEQHADAEDEVEGPISCCCC